MKGLIMAGGSGSRLRPLTCDLPKPMVPIMNKPVMTYSIELLRKYKIEDIGVTLQYLPQRIQDHFLGGDELKVSLHYFIEEVPLGTAGSVKNAEEFLDETFIVISGDALTDIDLQKAVDFHRSKNAIATLVLKRVEVPLEYGVVVTDKNGAITRFLEKPNWGEVFSDTVNTGIYILEPEVLDYFDAGKKFDFSQDLFPLLLNDGQPMFGYITDEYWCDIGNPQSYLQAHFDMLDNKVRFPISGKQIKEKVWVEEKADIDPSAVLNGPCYIGNYTRIGKSVEIGPYTVIQDYNEIGEQTSIRRSVLWNYNTLEKKVEIRGASICSKVEIKNNASIYEGAVIGDECQLNSHSIIKPDVKIWPGKSIDQGVIVQDNLIWGTKLTKTLFGKNGISGVVNVDINPQFMVRLGSAFGAELKPGKRIAVSSDQHNASVMLKTALSSGLLSSGTEVFDLGRLTTPILRYAVQYFGLDGGVHIYCKADNCNKTRAHFIDKQGSNLSPDFERKIENSFIRDDYQRQSADKLQRLNSINDIPMFYMRHLLNSIDADAIKKKKMKIILNSPNKFISSILVSILSDLDCEVHQTASDVSEALKSEEYTMGCIVDENGETLTLFDEKGKQITKEMHIALISLLYFLGKKGAEVIVPYNAPDAIEKLAESFDGKVIRTKSRHHALMEEILNKEKREDHRQEGIGMFSLYFDACAVIIKLMETLAEEDKKLSNLINAIPEFHMMEKAIECPWSAKGRVMRALIEEETNGKNSVELFEGIKVKHEKGWSLILPDSDEPVCRIYSEGISEEYAEELSSLYEEKINNIKKL